MADLPRIFANPQLPEGPGLPRPTPDSFGAGAFRSFSNAADTLGDSFRKIEEASVEAESRRAIHEAQAKIEDAIKQNDATVIDPDQYHIDTTKAVQGIYKSTLATLKNPKSQTKFNDALSPYLIKSQTAIDLDRQKKKVLKARGDSEVFYEESGRRLMETDDPGKRADIEKEIVEYTGAMVRTTALSQQEGAKKVIGILETDHLLRAYNELENSADPMKALKDIRQRFRFVAPEKAVQLLSHAHSRQREEIALADKREKEVRDMAMASDLIDATNGRLTQPGIEARAKARKYTPDQIKDLYRAYETGGVSDPNTEIRLEQQIREKKLGDYSAISSRTDLDQAAKSRLMGLIQTEGDEKHYSNQPAYREAKAELKTAVAPSGPLETFTKEESQRWLGVQRELSDRVERGENPKVVSRDIQARISREPNTTAKPFTKPQFPTLEDAARNLRKPDGSLDRTRFDAEALLHKQWNAYQTNEAAKAAAPRPTGTSGAVRR